MDIHRQLSVQVFFVQNEKKAKRRYHLTLFYVEFRRIYVWIFVERCLIKAEIYY